MKTVCKKLLSLMLVAMLLVSAIPFQASADEIDGIVPEEEEAVAGIEEPVTAEGETVDSGVVYDSGESDGSSATPAVTGYTVPVEIWLDGVKISDTDMFVTFEGKKLSVSLARDLAGYTSADDLKYKEFIKWTDKDGYTISTDSKLTLSDAVENKLLRGEFNLRVYFKDVKPGEGVKIVPVDVFVNNVFSHSTEVQIGQGGVTLDKTLASSIAPGYTFVKWAAESTTVTGSFYTSNTAPDSLSLYVTGTGSSSSNSGSSSSGSSSGSANGSTGSSSASGSNGSASGSTSTGTTNKFPYKVYLHIYLNNKVDVPAKTVDITEGIAVDGIVNMAEVKNVVRNYYNAASSNGIGYDGLYLARGNWVSSFAQDLDKYDSIVDILEARQSYEVHINVMVTNATAKTSSTADSTNPKTGDSIVMTVAALGLSASALAALCYVTSKKRRV